MISSWGQSEPENHDHQDGTVGPLPCEIRCITTPVACGASCYVWTQFTAVAELVSPRFPKITLIHPPPCQPLFRFVLIESPEAPEASDARAAPTNEEQATQNGDGIFTGTIIGNVRRNLRTEVGKKWGLLPCIPTAPRPH